MLVGEVVETSSNVTLDQAVLFGMAELVRNFASLADCISEGLAHELLPDDRGVAADWLDNIVLLGYAHQALQAYVSEIVAQLPNQRELSLTLQEVFWVSCRRSEWTARTIESALEILVSEDSDRLERVRRTIDELVQMLRSWHDSLNLPLPQPPVIAINVIRRMIGENHLPDMAWIVAQLQTALGRLRNSVRALEQPKTGASRLVVRPDEQEICLASRHLHLVAEWLYFFQSIVFPKLLTPLLPQILDEHKSAIRVAEKHEIGNAYLQNMKARHQYLSHLMAVDSAMPTIGKKTALRRD